MIALGRIRGWEPLYWRTLPWPTFVAYLDDERRLQAARRRAELEAREAAGDGDPTKIGGGRLAPPGRPPDARTLSLLPTLDD